MKRGSRLAVLLWFVLLSGLPAAVLAQGEHGAHGSMDRMQAYQMELMQPGRAHELLARLGGSWKMTIRMWPAPGADPLESSGTSAHEMILGGRFLSLESTGEMFGQPIEARVMLGFDGRTDRYSYVGFDTMGTYFVTADGEYDAETKTLTLSGVNEHPKIGLTEEFDILFRLDSADAFRTQVIFRREGEPEHMMVEIAYTRGG